jgi:hypothetical protein
MDGRSQYTRVVRLNNSDQVQLRAYPQPARNEVTLEHGTAVAGARLAISAANGQIVKKVDIQVGETQTLVDLTTLKAGLYLVRFDNGNGQTETVKLVKQ